MQTGKLRSNLETDIQGGKNMKVKKIMAMAMASAMILSLTACGGSSSDSYHYNRPIISRDF